MEMLAKDYKEQSIAMKDAFDVIDECIDQFNSKASENEFYIICGIVLAKARNLALGVFGLILDGLGQEAGALMRPFIEYRELLTYFRLDPQKIKEAMNHTLPSAGKRAQLINGFSKELREHFNDHASHSSFSDFSINHIIDKDALVIRKEQPMLSKVLFRNIGDLYIQIILLAIESIECLKPEEHTELTARIKILRDNGHTIFKLNERSKS